MFVIKIHMIYFLKASLLWYSVSHASAMSQPVLTPKAREEERELVTK